jgi:hypothetical protein
VVNDFQPFDLASVFVKTSPRQVRRRLPTKCGLASVFVKTSPRQVHLRQGYGGQAGLLAFEQDYGFIGVFVFSTPFEPIYGDQTQRICYPDKDEKRACEEKCLERSGCHPAGGF